MFVNAKWPLRLKNCKIIIIEITKTIDNYVNNILTTPKFYDVRLLPQYLKDQLIQKLVDYRDNRCPQKYKIVIEYGLASWKSFINEPFKGDRAAEEQSLLTNTVFLDLNRKQSFLEVNPQYVEWFREIRTRLDSAGKKWKIIPKVRKNYGGWYTNPLLFI